MHDQQENMFLFAQAQQAHTKERSRVQIEWTPNFLNGRLL
jgi:hypothetical protein